MKILESGTLSGITGSAWGSGVSSPPINLTNEREYGNVGIWASVQGDAGRTGGSVAVICRGSYSKSSVTYAVSNIPSDQNEFGAYALKAGTSVSGFTGDGTALRRISFPFPWLRLEGIVAKSGSTQHGSSTTNSLTVKWAVCQV